MGRGPGRQRCRRASATGKAQSGKTLATLELARPERWPRGRRRSKERRLSWRPRSARKRRSSRPWSSGAALAANSTELLGRYLAEAEALDWSKGRRLASSWAGARGEGYVVIQLILIGLVLLGPRTCPGLPEWPVAAIRMTLPAGITLAALGVGLIVTGIVALGQNLAAVPRPKRGATLVERGPYRVVRHPMYAGAIRIAFGWALAVAGTLSLVYACLVVAFLAIKTAREERWLREELVGYVDYERRARRLIPFVY